MSSSQAAPLDAVAICGPSGVGKGTLLGRLMSTYPNRFGYSVSHTTRPPRSGEQDGREYHFVDRATVNKLLAEGAFLEVCEVHGNLYGTSLSAVKAVQDTNKLCILEVDVYGAQKIRNASHNLNIAYLFIAPPNIESLRERIRHRGADNEEILQRRLQTAEAEMRFLQENPEFFSHSIINDNLEETYEKLVNAFNAEFEKYARECLAQKQYCDNCSRAAQRAMASVESSCEGDKNSDSCTRCGSEVVVSRYITLPETLWSLRHRYPSVLRFVLLQCTRCNRWVAQSVLRRVPDVVPTLTLPSAETSLTQMASETPIHWERIGHRPTRQRAGGGSPVSSRPEEGREGYFMPNPDAFTCQWTYCEMGDTWGALRERWIGELYAAMRGEEEDARRRPSHTAPDEACGPQQLNHAIAMELYGRRSKRIAGRQDTDPITLTHDEDDSDDAKEQSCVNALLRNGDAIVASFCWVSCEKCGKLRRLEHPFPGGAPFVCALARDVRSCSVPECNVLHSLSRKSGSDALQGHHALRETVVATRNGQPSLPTLRQLTTTLRKKALGSFVKNVMLAPDEVRRKRDEVLRSLFMMDADMPTKYPPQLNGEGHNHKALEQAISSENNGKKRSINLTKGKTVEMNGVDGIKGKGVKSDVKIETDVVDVDEEEEREEEETKTKGMNTKERKKIVTETRHEGGRVKAGVLNSGGNRKHARGEPLSSSKLDDPNSKNNNSKNNNNNSSASGKNKVNVKNNNSNGTSGTAQKRRGVSSNAEEDDTVSEEEDLEIIHWVRCDSCQKWRIIPEKISSSVKKWYCQMRDDGTTCDDTDDEVQMKRSEKKQKRRKTK